MPLARDVPRATTYGARVIGKEEPLWAGFGEASKPCEGRGEGHRGLEKTKNGLEHVLFGRKGKK